MSDDLRAREYPRPSLTRDSVDVSDSFRFDYFAPGDETAPAELHGEGGWRCIALEPVTVDRIDGRPTPARDLDPWSLRSDPPALGPIHFNPDGPGPFTYCALICLNRERREREQAEDRLYVTERGAQRVGELLALPWRHPTWAEIVAALEIDEKGRGPAYRRGYADGRLAERARAER